MAAKKSSSKAKQASRAKSWEAGEKRKEQRRSVQDFAAKRNAASGTSPWDEAKAARARRRGHV